MYVTRTISSLLRCPETMSEPPPGGPWSGVAAILDEDMIDRDILGSDCCGSINSIRINNLPIPQNALIFIAELSFGGDSPTHKYETFFMIPVVSEPLSSNTYYVVKETGKYAGLVNTCSSEEDSVTRHIICCFTPYKYRDQPKPFDPNNKGQHIKIVIADEAGQCTFRATNAAFPDFVTSHRWEFARAEPKSWSYKLNEADGQGLIESLRISLPDFGFSIGTKSSDHVVVGRWYVPFIFVKEYGVNCKEQMKNSLYYKMSLEQRWERVFEAENVGGDLVSVVVDVKVKSEVVKLCAEVAVQGGGRLVNGVVRFDSAHPGFRSIGLFAEVVERMKCEQVRAGWNDIGGGELRVERVEEHVGSNGWQRFGCYMLVERFVLKRLDGSLVLSYDFYHIHQLRPKWE